MGEGQIMWPMVQAHLIGDADAVNALIAMVSEDEARDLLFVATYVCAGLFRRAADDRNVSQERVLDVFGKLLLELALGEGDAR